MQWKVSGHPARLFDFSELDPHQPTRLFDAKDTVELSSVPALGQLTNLHAHELLEAGYEADAERAERFVGLGDGVSLTPVLRKLFVQAVEQGHVSESPFTEGGRQSLYEYFNQPAERGRAVGLTRLHLAIWESREDLSAAYPHIDGPDGTGYAGWLVVHGPETGGTHRLSAACCSSAH